MAEHVFDGEGVCQIHGGHCSMAADEPELVTVARAALSTHDVLVKVNRRGQAFEMDADDLPVDRQGWITWRETESEPAYAAWDAAMKELQRVMGSAFPGTHPFSFRPVCEEIVRGSGS